MLNHIAKIRNQIFNDKITSFGFEGDFHVKTESELKLLNDIPKETFRELYHTCNRKTVELDELRISDKIHVAIDTSSVNGYYESLEDFINANKYDLPKIDFYICELDYIDSSDQKNEIIENYKKIVSIIGFLEKVATHNQTTRGIKNMVFQKPDKICSIRIDYPSEFLKKTKLNESITDIDSHVLSNSDKETRIKLFSEELINILNQTTGDFLSIVNNWSKITSSYKSSFSLYLSEFSFQKVKASSQEYFHDLTDRIYSTIHKFSTYILAIPIAYIFILRFFDFSGDSFSKDAFLLSIGILYFLVIWFVLLNNLSKAFETIEKDINRFLERIENEDSLKEIIDNLKNQKNSLIPNQKSRILIVRIITLIILTLTISAFIYIHYEYLTEIIKSPVANIGYSKCGLIA